MARETTSSGPLVEAASGVAEALAQLEARIEKASRGPLRTARQIEQAARMLQELPEVEARIRERLLALGQAFEACGQRQVQLLEQAQARALQVASRASDLQALMTEHAELVEATRGLGDFVREAAARRADEAGLAAPGSGADWDEVAARSAELVARAAALMNRARELDFDDLVRTADSLRQQLLSLRASMGLAKRAQPAANS